TDSGVRRSERTAAVSTPPGTSCAMGTRRGRPISVVPPSRGLVAASAARQPSSAMVRHDTPLAPAAAPAEWLALSLPPDHSFVPLVVEPAPAGSGGHEPGLLAPAC